MEKTHAVNIYIVPSVPSVGRETKGCLIETGVGWLALECAVRKAWDATFQSSRAGQRRPGMRTAVGSMFHVEGTACAKTRGGKSQDGKKCLWGSMT